MQRRPSKYTAIAACAALFGLALAAIVVSTRDPVYDATDGVLRVAVLTLAALSFVTAEARLRGRRRPAP